MARKKKLARSKWFLSAVKPVHVGDYECRYTWGTPGILYLRHWDGKRWLLESTHTADDAWKCSFGDHGKNKWRGLAQEAV